MFTSAYTNGVTGSMLIDASHELPFKRLEATDSGPRLAQRRSQCVMLSAPVALAEHPQRLPSIASALMSSYASLDEIRGEFTTLGRSAAPVARHHWQPEVPLVIVTRHLRVYPDTERDFKKAIWRELQRDLAGRTSCSVHLIACYSGHYIPLEPPEMVVNAICIAGETARADDPFRGLPSMRLKQCCQPSF